MNKRVLIVRDSFGRWHLRAVAYNMRTNVVGETVYHCDRNLGGPFASLSDAIAVLEQMDSSDQTI